MDLCSIGFVVEGHVEHVVTGKNTVCSLEVPAVRQATVNWQDTSIDAIVKASQCAWLTKRNVNGFNVEDYLLEVVCFTQLIVVEPRNSSSSVVEDGFRSNHVDTREELVVCDGCCGNLFCINHSTGHCVGCVFVERELLECNVVERNTLESIIDSISTIVITLELKVDVGS